MRNTARLGFVLLITAACGTSDELFRASDGGPGGSNNDSTIAEGSAGDAGMCPAGKVWCPGCTPGTGLCIAGGCGGYACPVVGYDASGSDDGGADAGGDAGQCPAGQMWCPGCAPGTGFCSVGCTNLACPPVGSDAGIADAGSGDAGAKDAGGDAGQCPAGEKWCQGCTAGSGVCIMTGDQCGGVTQCPPVDAGTTDAGGDAGQCPPGEIWCPGCTPGTGSCGTGGCPGYQCPGADAGQPATCAQATTAAECAALTNCHAVYVDPGNCDCAASGCCTQFSLCANGGQADCKGAGLACTISSPSCESPYVMSYTTDCYEGCVLSTECAP